MLNLIDKIGDKMFGPPCSPPPPERNHAHHQHRHRQQTPPPKQHKAHQDHRRTPPPKQEHKRQSPPPQQPQAHRRTPSPGPSPPPKPQAPVVKRNKNDNLLQALDNVRQDGWVNQQWLEKKRQQLVQNAKRKAKDLWTLSTTQETVTRQWYSWSQKEWKHQNMTIQLDDKPFSEGHMRVAFRMMDLSRSEGKRCHAAKVQKPAPKGHQADDTEQYYVDVEMQACCRALAQAFNENEVPKAVNFVDAFVVKRKPTHLHHSKLLAVEPFLPGKYKKYNNNYGYVSMDDRNTPQAFSHFTYEYSRGKLMVVDIQGVDDWYTDPQIHTSDGRGYGKGNWGKEGIDKFFETHYCNTICRFLGLPIENQSGFKYNGTAIDPVVLRKGQGGAFKDDFSLTKFSRNLVPEKNSAYEEDLALLNMDMAQFNYLAELFKSYSKDGTLDWRDLFPLLDDLHFDFSERTVVGVVGFWDGNKDGKITFMEFLLWWTGQTGR
eukprot:TRINITY_DN62260_c0_g1_i1.p1 TRINITY_DN62260_c0_g1~~TRINITY_DN62260_c0_g1_i1.p1  ORF type:complete len:488 (+),score=61.49 TRINITY_DN62260_c0_g1_i1:46-1509(+)